MAGNVAVDFRADSMTSLTNGAIIHGAIAPNVRLIEGEDYMNYPSRIRETMKHPAGETRMWSLGKHQGV